MPQKLLPNNITKTKTYQLSLDNVTNDFCYTNGYMLQNDVLIMIHFLGEVDGRSRDARKKEETPIIVLLVVVVAILLLIVLVVICKRFCCKPKEKLSTSNTKGYCAMN